MSPVLILVASVILVLGLVWLLSAVKGEIANDLRHRRTAAEVARATSRLHRLEHDAMRDLHAVTEQFIDAEGEEQ